MLRLATFPRTVAVFLRLGLGLGVAAAASAGSSGCLFQRSCPNDVNGVRDGQVVQTTIVGPVSPATAARVLGSTVSTQESCGDLGDLPPGAVVTSKMTTSGPSEDCDDTVLPTIQSLSTATIDSASPGYATITLPDGCSGVLQLQFATQGGSYLAAPSAPADGGLPSWWLVRSFRRAPDAGACAPDAGALASDGGLPAFCADAFLAQNVIVTP
jgi:hypothetical protein